MKLNLIKNAKILSMTNDEIIDGIIIFDEKIRYVGKDYKKAEEFQIENTYDAEGGYVMPGMIDAHCHLGMVEDSLGFEGDDINDDSDPVTPQLRAIDAINPQDRGFLDALSAGVTTVVTGPGSANPISGQFAAIKTYGVCVDDMIVKAPCAMKMSLGENPKSSYHAKNQMPLTRMGTASLIRETLYKAIEYRDAMEKYNDEPDENEKPEFDMKYEALVPVINGEMPVKFHAHRSDDICTAIRIAKEFSLKYTIEHCTDGEIVKDILKRENAKVMLGPTLSDRSKPELKNMAFSTYKELSDDGIDVAIITDHPEIPIEYLPLCVSLAVKNGMDKMKALMAVTSIASRNCGICDRVGTISEGKDSDILIFDSFPTDFDAKIVSVFVDGNKII